MGSITSAPKIPKAVSPSVIYQVIQPSAPTPYTPTPSTSTPAQPAAQTPSDGEVAARVRESNLLSRSRGAFSTVLTGFRGLLSQTVQQSPRKTLLGE